MKKGIAMVEAKDGFREGLPMTEESREQHEVNVIPPIRKEGRLDMDMEQQDIKAVQNILVAFGVLRWIYQEARQGESHFARMDELAWITADRLHDSYTHLKARLDV